MPRRNPTKEEHYYQILKVLEPWIPKKQLEAWVFETIQKFKRSDRIQYVLMQVRMKSVLKLLAELPRKENTSWKFDYPEDKAYRKLQSLYWKFFDTYADPTKPIFGPETSRHVVYPPKFPDRLPAEAEDTFWSKLQSEYEELEHLMDTMETGGYPAALNIVWANQPINDMQVEPFPAAANPLLIRQLQEAVEKDRSEIATEFIVPENINKYGGSIFAQCGDNFAWYYLPLPEHKRVEAQLMNHCATPQRGVILSLREFVPQRGLRPHLTFEYIPSCSLSSIEILKGSVGILGEMKGYGNSKPTERYHPQILCLLNTPNILAVVGDSYLKENNFCLDDLSTEDQNDLFLSKPELFNNDLLLTTKTKELADWLNVYYPRMKILDGKLANPKFSDLTEALTYVVNEGLLSDCYYPPAVKMADQLERLVKILENSDELNMWSEHYGSHQLTTFFNAMQLKKYSKYYQQFIQTFREAIEKHNLSEQAAKLIGHIDETEWDEIPEELLETIQETARAAENVGWESGTVSAIAQELTKILPLETKREVITKDSIITSPKELFETLVMGEESNSISDEECQRVRRHIWQASERQEFDEDAAFDYFIERYREET